MKKIILTVAFVAASALCIVGHKQTSMKTLVQENVEALSWDDDDFYNHLFGILTQHNLYEYTNDYTPDKYKTLYYASRSGICFDPRIPEQIGYWCDDEEWVDSRRKRYGIYCYTRTSPIED